MSFIIQTISFSSQVLIVFLFAVETEEVFSKRSLLVLTIYFLIRSVYMGSGYYQPLVLFVNIRGWVIIYALSPPHSKDKRSLVDVPLFSDLFELRLSPSS